MEAVAAADVGHVHPTEIGTIFHCPSRATHYHWSRRCRRRHHRCSSLRKIVAAASEMRRRMDRRGNYPSPASRGAVAAAAAAGHCPTEIYGDPS